MSSDVGTAKGLLLLFSSLSDDVLAASGSGGGGGGCGCAVPATLTLFLRSHCCFEVDILLLWHQQRRSLLSVKLSSRHSTSPTLHPTVLRGLREGKRSPLFTRFQWLLKSTVQDLRLLRSRLQCETSNAEGCAATGSFKASASSKTADDS
jgi:hypothetical protein